MYLRDIWTIFFVEKDKANERSGHLMTTAAQDPVQH